MRLFSLISLFAFRRSFWSLVKYSHGEANASAVDIFLGAVCTLRVIGVGDNGVLLMTTSFNRITFSWRRIKMSSSSNISGRTKSTYPTLDNNNVSVELVL